jgi:undecaprenyl-diphosphatase
MIIFGILLFFADKFGSEKKSLKNLNFKESLFIGLFQAFALIPGVSRSGISITGFRIFGYNKYDAIKISLMMSIPTILLSAFFISPEILEEEKIGIFEILIPFILSFITAFLTLKIMVRYIYVFGFTPYIIYRIFLGIILLFIAYS